MKIKKMLKIYINQLFPIYYEGQTWSNWSEIYNTQS